MALYLDIELETALSTLDVFSPSTVGGLLKERERLSSLPCNNLPTNLAGISHEEYVVPGRRGDVTISVFSSSLKTEASKSVGFFFIHPGGMIFGSRFLSCEVVLEWVRDIGAVCVTAEYRLAPEFPDPAPIEDCYTALEWMAANAATLSFNPAMLFVVGVSAGGGLAAGLTLLCRDREGPFIAAQILIGPMLDPDMCSPSSYQPVPQGIWGRASNEFGWSCRRGGPRGTKTFDCYSAPGHATDLCNLPTTFIDVGECEIFRDECMAFASRLLSSGVPTELHVWRGAFHSFDLVIPEASISILASKTRTAWLYHTIQRFQTAVIPARELQYLNNTGLKTSVAAIPCSV